MIFFSHNHKDKPVVDIIAQKIAAVFGQDKIFYDSWSIQPGDGVIDKVNSALENCKFFFFFVSKNSLGSEMVKLEWQNALIKKTKGQTKIIPVKLDDCMMPAILLQSLYVDMFGKGIDNALRQIIDVVNGKNTYRSGPQTYENIRGYIKHEENNIVIEFRAETYLEPISRYLILVQNKKEELQIKCKSDGIFMSGFNQDLQLNNGIKTNAFAVSVERSTSPGFPLIIEITSKDNNKIELRGLMRAISHEQYKLIPVIPK